MFHGRGIPGVERPGRSVRANGRRLPKAGRVSGRRQSPMRPRPHVRRSDEIGSRPVSPMDPARATCTGRSPGLRVIARDAPSRTSGESRMIQWLRTLAGPRAPIARRSQLQGQLQNCPDDSRLTAFPLPVRCAAPHCRPASHNYQRAESSAIGEILAPRRVLTRATLQPRTGVAIIVAGPEVARADMPQLAPEIRNEGTIQT